MSGRHLDYMPALENAETGTKPNVLSTVFMMVLILVFLILAGFFAAALASIAIQFIVKDKAVASGAILLLFPVSVVLAALAAVKTIVLNQVYWRSDTSFIVFQGEIRSRCLKWSDVKEIRIKDRKFFGKRVIFRTDYQTVTAPGKVLDNPVFFRPNHTS